MKNREIKKTVAEIFDALCDRSGFDDWWYNLEDDIKKEVEDMVFQIIKKRVD